MKFCSECAQAVTLKIPEDDSRERFVCTACATIHYQNPKLVLGTLPIWQEDGVTQVLLCKRAIEPRYGYWTLPAGFMENAETTEEAAIRETQEEAGANIDLLPLYSLVNVPHVHQVHLFYRARLIDKDFAAGIESLDVRLFSEEEIPWDDIAFTTVAYTLRRFFEDSKRIPSDANFPLHTYDVRMPLSTASA